MDKPYVLYVAELIYKKISDLKENSGISTNDAIEGFMGSKTYNEISSGKFHDNWFKELEDNNFIDTKSGKKIPQETIKLLKLQKDMLIKQLIRFPELYFTKSHYPLEISQRAFDNLWRMCESYELWCRESKQEHLIILNIID
jgi:hypothetical protein|tara:strand:- start:399 stop:824 length:426 start_codon:yes stop_codon:yes gene_type:complete